MGLRGPSPYAVGKAIMLVAAVRQACLAHFCNASDDLTQPTMPPGFIEDDNA